MNILIIGLGYVGTSLSLLFGKKNYVTVSDIDKQKLDNFNSGKLPIDDQFSQDYLINNKVPLAEKPDYKILEDGNNSIIAVLFPSNKSKDVSHYGIPSDQQKCTQATTLVLQIGLKSSTN